MQKLIELEEQGWQALSTDGDAAPSPALISSTYARSDGEWKLVLHQQTPN